MARSKVNGNVASEVTTLIVQKDVFKEKLEGRIQDAKIILDMNMSDNASLKKARETYYAWDEYNSELLKHSFSNPDNEYRERYAHCTDKFIYGGYSTFSEEVREFVDDINIKANALSSIINRLELIPSTASVGLETPQKETVKRSSNSNVFIVHGHDSLAKTEVARTLEKLGLHPIILHEKPNQGKTVIEKFEKYSDVGFAVILLTPDDEGKAVSAAALSKRARQNVILELGYFIGRLGRDRVCPLYSPEVELPSDLNGIAWTELDAKGLWKYELSKELRSAGYKVDANDLLS